MSGSLLKRGNALSTVMSWGRARSVCTMLIVRNSYYVDTVYRGTN